MKATANR